GIHCYFLLEAHGSFLAQDGSRSGAAVGREDRTPAREDEGMRHGRRIRLDALPETDRGAGRKSWNSALAAVLLLALPLGASAQSAGPLAWGNNANGRLGDGSTTQRSQPVPIGGLPGVLSLAAGGSHSLAVGADGSVWAWGSNA